MNKTFGNFLTENEAYKNVQTSKKLVLQRAFATFLCVYQIITLNYLFKNLTR